MSDQARVSHPILQFLPSEIQGFDSLAGTRLGQHGRGIMPPTKCCANSIPNSGRSRITPGLFPIPPFVFFFSFFFPSLPSVFFFLFLLLREIGQPRGYA